MPRRRPSQASTPRWRRARSAAASCWRRCDSGRTCCARSARTARRRGLDLCAAGQPQQGILWLARALEFVPAGGPDDPGADKDRALEETLRVELAQWQRNVIGLRAVLRTDSPATAEFVPGEAAILTSRQEPWTSARLFHIQDGKWVGRPMRVAGRIGHREISPDGKRVLLCSDKEVRLYDAATWSPLRPPLEHPAPVRRAKWSPDGQRVLVEAQGALPYLWEVGSGKPTGGPLESGRGGGQALFVRGGKAVATLAEDQLQLWDAQTRKPLCKRVPVPSQGRDKPAVLAPDGRLLAVFGPSGVALCDLAGDVPVVRPLMGTAAAQQVVFSPDAKMLAVRTADGARLWDVGSGQPASEPIKLSPGDNAVFFSPAGARAVGHELSGQQWQVILRDLRTGKALGRPLPSPAYSVSSSPDGRRFLLVGAESVLILDSVTGEPVGRPLRLASNLPSAVFAPAGKGQTRVLTGEGLLAPPTRLWDAETGRVLAGSGPNGPGELTCSPDGSVLLVVENGWRKQGRLWDAVTGRPRSLPQGDPVLAVSPDGQRVLLLHEAGEETSVGLYAADTGKPLGPPLPHSDGVIEAAFSPDGRTVLTRDAARAPRLWEPLGGRVLMEPPPGNGGPAVFSADGSLWMGVGREFRCLDASTGRPRGEAMRHAGLVAQVQPGPSGLALAWDDEEVRLWDTAGTLRGGPWKYERRTQAAFSPSGDAVVFWESPKTARLWRAGKEAVPVLAHEHFLQRFEFSPAGETLLTSAMVHAKWGSRTREARLWRVSDGEPLGSGVQGDWDQPWAFSPRGGVLALVEGEEVRLRNAGTGQPQGPTLRPHARIQSLRFNADGTRLLTISVIPSQGDARPDSWEAHLWDAHSGAPVGSAAVFPGDSAHAEFSPDGRVLLVALPGRGPQLWDARTGKPLCDPLAEDGKVPGVAFAGDGRLFLTWMDRQVRIWERQASPEEVRPSGTEPAAASADGAWHLRRQPIGVLTLFDPATGKPLGPPLREPGALGAHGSAPIARGS